PLTDLSTNFRLYRRDALQSVRFEGENFDVQEDLLVRLVNAGWDMVEVPQYHRRRLGGESHVQLLRFAIGYARTLVRLWRLRWARREGRALVRASLAALPFPDARFDAVVWSESRDRLADTERPLDELARVLAPGGWLILRVVHLGHRPLLEALRAHGLAVEST